MEGKESSVYLLSYTRTQEETWTVRTRAVLKGSPNKDVGESILQLFAFDSPGMLE